MSTPGARIERATRVLAVEADAVHALSKRLDAGFSTAVDLLKACRGKVVVTGMGKSGLVGRKIAATLASTGTPAFFLHPAEGIHGDVGMLLPGDAVVALSNSGETEELVRLLPVFKRLGVPIVAVTGRRDSTLARYADAVLDVSVAEEACPLGLAPTASTTATLAMGDALAVVLLEEKGFSATDFADRHPGGSLGRRLLLVADLMHSGDGLPVVSPSTPLSDALITISTKRLGMTAVVAADGSLEGVITDGDVRRALERRADLFASSASDVMTRNPKRIGSSALAAEALRKMEEHQITALLVVDGEPARAVGVVHVHDLLKAGVQ